LHEPTLVFKKHIRHYATSRRLEGPRLDREKLAGKAQELDSTIRELTTMRDLLWHAAACPARTYMECATYRRFLRAASGTKGAGGKVGARPT